MDKLKTAEIGGIIIKLQPEKKENTNNKRTVIKVLEMSDFEAASGFVKVQREMFRGCTPGGSLF